MKKKITNSWLGGKLPVTLYAANYINEVNFMSMDMTKAPGRTYRYYTGTPLYAFGFGLSYTTFKIVWFNTSQEVQRLSNSHFSQTVYKANITNTGNIPGDDVVQGRFRQTTLGISKLSSFSIFRTKCQNHRSIDQTTFWLPTRAFRPKTNCHRHF